VRCFTSLNISLSHSRSLKVIRNDTLEYSVCKLKRLNIFNQLFYVFYYLSQGTIREQVLFCTASRCGSACAWFVCLSVPNVHVFRSYRSVANQHKLEGHSVERMYLRQRCSDGSRWIQPFWNHASLQRRAANTYTWDFPDIIKFRVAALIRYLRKKSGFGILTIIRIGLKS